MGARLLCVAPELPVSGLESALRWYRDQLGFETRQRLDDYAIVSRDGVDLNLFVAAPDTAPASLHIYASGIDDLAAEVAARGAGLHQALESKPWGTRDFRVRDPFGNELKFTESR